MGWLKQRWYLKLIALLLALFLWLLVHYDTPVPVFPYGNGFPTQRSS